MSIRNALIGLGMINTILFLAVISAFIMFNKDQQERLEGLISRDLVFSREVDQTYSVGLRTGIALRNLVIDPGDDEARETFERSKVEFLKKATNASHIHQGKAGAMMTQTIELWNAAELFKQRIMELVNAGQRDLAMEVIAEDNEVWREIKLLIDQVKTEQDKELQLNLLLSRKAYKQGQLVVLVLLGINLGMIAFTVLFAFRRVLKPLESLACAVDVVGSGNLICERLSSGTNDEMGKLSTGFDRMVNQLRLMAANISHSIDELQQISTRIESSGDQMTTSTNLQAEAVGMTTAAIMDIDDSIRKVATWIASLSVTAKEIETSTNKIVASIEEVAGNIDGLERSAGEVGTSVEQMVVTSHDIEVSVQRLSEIAEATASSTFEMSNSIKEVVINANDSAEISGKVLTVAESGKVSVEATITGMTDIRKASNLSIQSISDLKIKAADISNILEVIADVTEQTNLLALNAAIIAAQAGPYGKGFAVIAEEIMGLAERTNISAVEISDVVNSVNSQIQDVFAALKQAESDILKGEQLSMESGEVLNQIVAGVKMITDRMHHIARATIEQAKGSNGIRESMEQVLSMVDTIAKATTDQSVSSDTIKNLVASMQSLTADVNRSIKEQAAESSLIARHAEQTANFILDVKKATDDQLGSSNQIVSAAHAIQQSTQGNNLAVGELDDVISSFAAHIEVMRLEMTKFKCEIDKDVSPSLHQAKSAHMIFVGKINAHLDGKARFDAMQLPDHRTCTFGKWYLTDGEHHCGQNALFKSIDEPHAQVHELGKQAIVSYDAGDIVTANRQRAEMIAQSEILLGIIDHLALEQIG